MKRYNEFTQRYVLLSFLRKLGIKYEQTNTLFIDDVIGFQSFLTSQEIRAILGVGK